MEQEELTKYVRGAMRGNKNALVILCDSILEGLLLRISGTLKSASDAEDVAQEVLIRVCSNIRKLREPAVFGVWLNKITVNEINRFLAKSLKQGVVLDIDDYRDAFKEEDEELLPLENAVMEDTRKMVLEIVQNLPERQSQAVLLHYYDGLSVTEAAERMGVTKSFVSQCLSLAREKIKKRLSALAMF